MEQATKRYGGPGSWERRIEDNESGSAVVLNRYRNGLGKVVRIAIVRVGRGSDCLYVSVDDPFDLVRLYKRWRRARRGAA